MFYYKLLTDQFNVYPLNSLFVIIILGHENENVR